MVFAVLYGIMFVETSELNYIEMLKGEDVFQVPGW